ncbi:hypothetical protein [Chelativorans sp. AA-79]|uniref:hypothetical protein n=1 Tax=Chelativorans sp. AA-79 TaxID=3028735 RepID=UPI0023F807C1|nr:hypothetical protein [Chelativorans sp. AA-79]WEX08448.1 hypothetical protein PVE73_20595 [Chelativorans sp. AA-79]
MSIKTILITSSFACIISLLPVSAYAQNHSDSTEKNSVEVLQFPSIEVKNPGIYIRYNFTKKENTSSLDTTTSAEHFSNRIFRLFEDNKTWYGLYAFDGNPETDEKFIGYYLNAPRDKNDSVLYIKIHYDNKTHKFKEELIMPDGKKVFEEGTFEIVEDGKR